MFYNQSIYKLFFGLVFFVFTSCASVMSPSGGPKDLKPPVLIETIPSELTSIKEDQVVTLVFDEFINENSIKNSISIYPSIQKKLEYSYEGKNINLKIPAGLDVNKTYTININKKFSDENNVTLKKDIDIPFSFSKTISSGNINGEIFGYFDNVSILIWSKVLSKEILSNTSPDYVVSANKDFSFKYLPNGNFTIIAVDNYKSNSDLTLQKISMNKLLHFKIDNNNTVKLNFYFNKISKDDLELDNLQDLELKFSSLSGKITGNYLLPMVTMLSGNNSYFTSVDLEGKFNFQQVNEGEYELIIFEDRNNNKILDSGSFENDVEAENFYVYDNILELRSNWEFEIPEWIINE